jgi:uncharacterized membrane protein
MKKEIALKVIFWISLAGILFSGYLSYSELFLGVCVLGEGCSFVLGLPSCVYGFAMYLIIFIISLLSLRK